uniref:Uncharacterized protein n=1 Tax=Odontella aurita TaxID=265563 RepID=A0A7S4J7I6_9STRA|mmetsp:Transcript_40393/g.121687  ORF Transcript_40393/g.121687 Transcript_40393/m.121687 type:complete len:101 (+) Transcript_40393:232-534(+)|eukprot:CAMPEP_0113533224 /NCGR_PEP_ID=MMETSP0015_2-20120614/4481_1 /TAXON_ID=2838 /ORGANISM="Odontella" /LENGTH=100 /DNA_ID=CAMNT_0000432243 /DNA_START=230 /DNA_END=532 /DNA_ORIENTATION=+ /assembly_acc=CAM_ASM_000160
MKLFSLLFVACGSFGLAAAFSPKASFGVSSRYTTRTFMQGNQMESYLDSLDASKAVILECDNEGCDMVEATHDDEGWHYGDGHSAQKDAEIVMLEKEDTE